MNTFLTLNPHIVNLSKTRLRNDFKFYLQKYYRSELGQRYDKHKDKQYPIAIFEETGKQFFSYIDKHHITQYITVPDIDKNEPHLHIIADVPVSKMKKFVRFIRQIMRKTYSSLTSDFQIIRSKQDEANVYTYCLKEGGEIITNSDLYERITNIN